jgi:glycosyltransferase involved in cell wall biosynthesis
MGRKDWPGLAQSEPRAPAGGESSSSERWDGMVAGYEIIAITDEWGGLPFSCKHLLGNFLPEVPLLWVETIGLRSPRLNLYDLKRGLSKLAGWIGSSREDPAPLPENLTVLDVFQVPYNHLRAVRKLNVRLLARAVAASSRGRPPRRRVLLTTWPFLGDLVGRLGEELSIYYRVDDFSEFPGVEKEAIRKLEEELMEKVDLVVASAEHLARTASGKEARYLPHGVDFDHFASSDGLKDDLPILRIPPPRIGFFGLLDAWVDLELLDELAQGNPEWSFVFIGPSQLPLSSLPKRRNMHFLGPVSYRELPSHARHFQVGMIPFRVNALTRSVNPLKLMEYLSLGLPVVSTPIPEVAKYGREVAIAGDSRAFAEAIGRALSRPDAEARGRRQEIARSHSWASKSAELREWIEKALEQRLGVYH